MRSFLLLASLAAGAVATATEPSFGVVNFATCISESKTGKKEQENMETLRNQMASMIEQTDKELKEISAKFEDTEYLDSLSPKAEEELKQKFQSLQEDMGRYQNQFYQVLQHANYQMVQKMSGAIAQASSEVAKEKGLTYVFNKEACFYVSPEYDLTATIVSKLDQSFESETNKLSKNEEISAPAVKESQE
jgi:outer membrane protein